MLAAMSEELDKHNVEDEKSDDGILKAVIPTMDEVKTNDQELPAKSINVVNNDEEIESEEEIITQSIPPTEIVDTVVTTTTNPDGSLKRTTRKTTRTLMTTTRVRRIKTKSPVANDVRNPDLDTETTDELPEVNCQPPTLYTVIGPREHSQDDQGESRITQATFTFLPPTTRTEVTYEEADRDVSEIDPEAVKHLRQFRSDSKAGETMDLQSNSTDSPDASEQSKARTKTTVRKTVTASAATATFVATGKPKNIPGSPSNLPESTIDTNNPEIIQPSTDAFSLMRKFGQPELNTDLGKSAVSSEHEVSQNVGGATTVTKRTTRVVNNLASKSLLFTKTSLESLKKPFAHWSKELRHDNTTSRIPEEQSAKVSGSSTIEPVDTEQLALMTLKESERLFSEAKILMPASQDEVDNAQGERIFTQPSSGLQSENNAVSEVRFHSRFANLPLYQGYGLIAQQLALCKQQQLQLQQESQNEPVESIGSISAFTSTTSTNTTTTTTTTVKSPEPSTTFTNAAEWFGQTNGEFGPGIELNLATNALVSLLDESTERFLKEAAKQWYRIGCTSFELPGKITQSNLGIPETKKSISWSEQLSGEKGDETVDSYLKESADRETLSDIGREGIPTDAEFAVDMDIPQNESVTQSVKQQPQQEEQLPANDSRPHLSRLGVSSTGAFRVAWSEMPEVVNCDALKRLTKHEIQLQEAMFEVITSEASYYQSLNVLVNHFYHAPEFGYTTPTSLHSPAPARSDVVSGSMSTTVSPNSTPNTIHVSGNTGTTQLPTQLSASLGGDSSVDNIADTSANNLGPTTQNTNNRRPLLKPLEKHHLFSNVLLVCLASEKFLQDLETRWVSQMPILSEVCDLIVKHAGGVNFEPYVTYLRNQAYQMETLRKLCQRESFRTTLEALHSNPISGKNSLSSFLALPMQRLTRLKLLVEVIRRLQDAVLRDATEPGIVNRPHRVPTDRERENVQLALCELSRLLASSETEKELMDQKARLLSLSTSLEFSDNVKSIAISDKRLIKEGELQEVALDGRIPMLQKLSLRKPNSFYFILFNDLLLVTKRKKNDRYLVLDYCDRADIQAEVQRIGSQAPKSSSNHGFTQRVFSTTESPQKLFSTKINTTTPSVIPPKGSRALRPKTTTEFSRLNITSLGSLQQSPNKATKQPERSSLARSGSSLSSYSVGATFEKFRTVNQFNSSQSISDQVRSEFIHLLFTTSHNESFTEFNLFPRDSEEFVGWCKALGISPVPVQRNLQQTDLMEEKSPESADRPTVSKVCRRLTIGGIHKRKDSSLNRETSPTNTHPSTLIASSQAKGHVWLQRARKVCSFRRASKPASPKRICTTNSSPCPQSPIRRSSNTQTNRKTLSAANLDLPMSVQQSLVKRLSDGAVTPRVTTFATCGRHVSSQCKLSDSAVSSYSQIQSAQLLSVTQPSLADSTSTQHTHHSLTVIPARNQTT